MSQYLLWQHLYSLAPHADSKYSLCAMSINLKTSTNKPYWQFQKIEWRKFITFLVAANIITIAVPWAIYGLGLIIPTGEAGWGFLLLTPLWYAGVVFAAVNIVSALVYLLTRKSNLRTILLSIATIVLSVAYLSVFIH